MDNATQNDYDLFDDKKSAVAGYVRGAGGLILILISALATYGFFSQFNSSFLSTVLPEGLAQVGSGIIGVVLLEGGVIWWHYLNVNDADTNKQIKISKAGYMFSIFLSVAITAVYLMLTNSLISPFVTTDLLNKLSLAGLFIIVASVVTQFWLSREYDRSGAKVVEAESRSKLLAAQNKAQDVISFAHTQQRLDRTVEEIRKALPEMTDRQALHARDDFLTSQTRIRTGDRSQNQNGRQG